MHTHATHTDATHMQHTPMPHTYTTYSRRKGHDTTSHVKNSAPYEMVKKAASPPKEMDAIDAGMAEETQYATISGEPARQGMTTGP